MNFDKIFWDVTWNKEQWVQLDLG